jgi:Uma2 family endonuclease
MTAATQHRSAPKSARIRRMTLERFRDWKPTDGWKYVWENGIITKDKNMVTQKQRYIIQNILRNFVKTAYYEDGGNLMAECEMPVSPNRYRIPDIGYFTNSQTTASANQDDSVSQICGFVVEVISETDSLYAAETKLWEYFDVGVQVVWHIFPEHKLVKVFTSPGHMTLCITDDICTAAPCLPNFTISVNDIFKK